MQENSHQSPLLNNMNLNQKQQHKNFLVDYVRERFILPNKQIVPSSIFNFLQLVSQQGLNKNSKCLIASLGKPTFPVNQFIVQGQMQFWQQIFKNKMSISYGDSHGQKKYREMIATALSKQYLLQGQNKFISDDVIFTIGGIGGIRAIINSLSKINPKKYIFIVFPYYSGYTAKIKDYYNVDQFDPLKFINLPQSGNLTLNVKALQKALQNIEEQNVGSFIFCDPNNPCGTTPTVQEWAKISKVLEKYPKSLIILDEAYRELVFEKQCMSLITVCPHLLSRIVLLRSGTKGLSVAGQRMSVILSKNKNMLYHANQMVLHENICIPLSAQHAYSYALTKIQGNYKDLSNYYKQKIDYIKSKLIQLKIFPKDIRYCPNSTFYLLADLSVLRGKSLDQKAKQVLLDNKMGKIETDVDACVNIFYRHNIALSPMSFLGINPEKLYIRITCADQLQILTIIINALKEEIEKQV